MAAAVSSSYATAAEARTVRSGSDRGGGAFRPRCFVAGGGEAAATTLPLLEEMSGGDCGEGEEEEEGGGDEEGEQQQQHQRASPSKRQRATPRPHNIPRPCLDFEKMQQVSCWQGCGSGSGFSDFADLDPYWESGTRGKKMKKFQWKKALFSYF
jgi:hypothetical protein